MPSRPCGSLAQRTVKAIRHRIGLRVTHVDASAPSAAPTSEARPILNSISSTSPLHLLAPHSPPLPASTSITRQRSIDSFIVLTPPGQLRDHVSRSCCSRSARLLCGAGRTTAGIGHTFRYDAARYATLPPDSAPPTSTFRVNRAPTSASTLQVSVTSFSSRSSSEPSPTSVSSTLPKVSAVPTNPLPTRLLLLTQPHPHIDA